MHFKKFILFLFTVILASCQHAKNDRGWHLELKNIGSFSSPQLADLTGDGIPDIVLGTGGEEWQKVDTGVIAVDGKTGVLLWKVSARNQIVGSALFQDINGDGVPDVFIGGRSAELKAMDGKTGKILWEFLATNDPFQPKKQGWFNFFNAQFIADQNNDQLPDILTANGGDATIMAGDTNRPTGRLLIISSKDGKIISQASMPDGRETYMSPVITDFGSVSGGQTLFFGTGGETVGGHLYRATLQELLSGDLSKAVVLAKSAKKGFIAPPILADITHDGVLDIVCNAVEGKILAVDGVTNQVLWEVSIPYAEAYSMPAIGQFTGDPTPDFFCNYAIGVWPSFLKSVQFLVDGSNGKIIENYEIGTFSYASPLAVDYNNDGYSEVLFNVNYGVFNPATYENTSWSKLLVLDFANKRKFSLGDSIQGNNGSSTPWLGDLNGNGKLDIIHCANTVRTNSNPESASQKSQPSLKINRFETEIDVKNVGWGGYMGTDHTGVFKRKMPEK